MLSRVSVAFDRLLPASYSVEGSRHYRHVLLPGVLKPELRIWDIGSGRYPMISKSCRDALRLHVTGLDLSAEELALADYDRAVAADACTFVGEEDADLVVSHCCFEHLPDTEGGFRAVASILKPGGVAVIYNPSRAALFAKLNLLIPEGVKRWFLSLLPHKGGHGGWPAVYDRATPKQFEILAYRAGLDVVAVHRYWISGYFLTLPPLHVAWRGWQALHRLWKGDEAAESFTMVLRKPG